MRIALVVHAFPPHSRTGVEVYCQALARALASRGHRVEVFAPRVDPSRAYLSQRRVVGDDFAVTWLTLEPEREDESGRRSAPGAAGALERFLEREQPDVVHFQHLLGFGPAAIDVARASGRAVLFSAHDAFAISDEYTLTAPDLSPLDPTDFEAAARCRLARGLLDRHLDAHDGFLVPGDTDPALAEEVAGVLGRSDVRPAGLGKLTAQLRRTLSARIEALSRVDHFEAPTRFLAETIRAAGLGREVVVRPFGIDLRPLAEIPRRRRAAGEPLRVLYIGGYYEHKGVHVLLEAFEGLAGSATLCLRGCAGSSSYRDTLAAAARRCGVELGGPFERAELPRLLGAADLLVLPSLWPENAPFVIREAFAAGLPVIASDTPALRESVRDGRDGLLVPAGDARALGQALLRCATDDEWFEQLVRGVRAPLAIEEDARQLEERYAELLARTAEGDRRRRRRLPAHLASFAERFEALSRVPTRELFERAARGLEGLAEPGVPSARALCQLFDSGQGLRERLAEARRAVNWRADVAADRERALNSLRGRVDDLESIARAESQRADWKEELLEERDERLHWKDGVIEGHAHTSEALRAQFELAERTSDSLRAQLELSERTRTEFEGRIADQAKTLDSLEEEQNWRVDELRHQEQALEWTRGVLEDREVHLGELKRGLADERKSVEASRNELRESQSAREDLQRTLSQRALQLAELEQELSSVRATLADLGQDRQAARKHQGFLEVQLSNTEQHIVALGRELEWRSAQMLQAQGEGSGMGQKLFGARLHRRLEQWRRQVDGESEDGAEDA